MPSLKEVKTRIASVNSTRKITSAMKMVASSKLHRAQQAIEQMRPYEQSLHRIMDTFVGSMDGELSSPYAVKREVKRVAVIAYSSNSSLCGGFNANVGKELRRCVEACKSSGITVVKVYPIGRKVAEVAQKLKLPVSEDCSSVLDHPAYAPVAAIAAEVMDMYRSGEIDRAEVIGHHFKSTSTQVLRHETFLPIQLEPESKESPLAVTRDYIVEPSAEDIMQELVPKSLHLRLYTELLDSLASEHAARVIAMQVATDNADELLRELTLMYNKTRQQAITNELLDIVGGSMQ